MPEVRTYRLLPEGFDVFFRRSRPIVIGLMVAPLVVVGAVSSQHGLPTDAGGWLPLVVLAAGGAIAVAFGVHRAKAAALVRWNEWRMAVSSNALRITGWGPAMELTRAQVTGITRLPGRGIVVEGATQLTLPEHIEGVEEVEQHLRRWMDGEPPPAPDVLRSELDQLREAAPYAASNVRGRFGTRFVVFALVCAVAFLAIWQFLDSSR